MIKVVVPADGPIVAIHPSIHAILDNVSVLVLVAAQTITISKCLSLSQVLPHIHTGQMMPQKQARVGVIDITVVIRISAICVIVTVIRAMAIISGIAKLVPRETINGINITIIFASIIAHMGISLQEAATGSVSIRWLIIESANCVIVNVCGVNLLLPTVSIARIMPHYWI
jgi:hypothetical protein